MADDDSILQLTCTKCTKEITSSTSKVTCDKCQSSYHELCVKANENVQVWSCFKCNSGDGSHFIPPPAPTSKRSKKFSKHSSSSSKAQELLKALDEEKKLLEKQAKEKEELLNDTHKKQLDLMRKRQEVMIELASERGSRSSLKGIPQVDSVVKVANWIESQPQVSANEVGVEAQSNNLRMQPSSNAIQLPPPSSAIQPPQIQYTINPPALPTMQSSARADNIIFKRDELQSSTQRYVAPLEAGSPKNKEPKTYIPGATFEIENRPSGKEPTHESHGYLSRNEIASRHVVKDLPKFDGNPRHWPKFITSFHRSTKICGYSNSENLERLTNCLHGNALLAVGSSLNLDENVPHILDTLELLFGQPEFVINSLIEDLRKSPCPTLESIDSILQYSLEIENISMTMVYAKLAEHVWNPILLSEMIDKLPTQLKLEWAAYKYGHGPCSIEVFSMWLKSKAVTYASILSKPPSFRNTTKRESTSAKHSVNIHQEGQTSSTKKCLVCQKTCATPEHCEKFNSLNLKERWDLVRKLQLCRICLKRHRGKRCANDSICGIDGCEYRHHKLLHKKREVTPEENADNAQHVAPINIHEGSTTFFKILPVLLSSGEKTLWTYAMLDDGSGLTLVDNSIAKALNVTGERHALSLRWTNGVERRESSSMIVNFNISKCRNGRQFNLSGVRTIEDLQLPEQTVNMEQLASKYAHLKDVKLESFRNVRPLLLIGLNHSKLMTVQKYRFGRDEDPAAAKAPLGWCIFGSGAASISSVFHIQSCGCEDKLNRNLEELVRKNYSLDAIGVSNPSSLPQAKEEGRALEILNKTVAFDGVQYEIGLLWKFNEVSLPNSLPMAVKRLACLENKMKSDRSLRDVLNNQVDDYVQKGYAKKLPAEALTDSDAWYLPIFVVRNANKPEKIRMVWDAAASVKGISLNDVLLKGPDLLSSLPGILLRFREHQIAVTGDIKEMFHQIKVRQSDRKYQRFLHRRHEDEEIAAYEMCVMTFGACCSPCCSQFIKNLNAEKFKNRFPVAAGAIQSNHYVDDWLQSMDTEEEAISLAEQVRYVHHKGGFVIHKWISNSPLVVQRLNSDSSEVGKSLELSPKLGADKILGMFWSTLEDRFQFTLKQNHSNSSLMIGKNVPTKRDVLRILMSIFDPLGLITPVLIFPKILLQNIWRSKINWDVKIKDDHYKLWISWCENLHHLQTIAIPRWIGLKSGGTHVEIHTFVDASEDAFCAAVYFKVMQDSNVSCSLIMSKSRVSPLKSLSIPRLELQAAVLGVRLTKFVTENSSPTLIFSKRYYWTDSETVIKWINSDSRKYTQFVSCRVGEILEHSTQTEWHWISGKVNVADMGTKLRLFDELQMYRWFQGPEFLYNDSYPVQEIEDEDCDEELRPSNKSQPVLIHEEVEYRVSKWTKLRRTLAFVFRYVSILKARAKNVLSLSGPLTSEEYRQAEAYLLRKAQKEGYNEEYSVLEAGKKLKNRRSPIYKDLPFLDPSAILRAKGRIQSAPLISYDAKNPILLPKNHRVTEMILQFYHEKYHHMYISTVANEIKQKFVVPRLKVKLNFIRRHCQHCKNRDAKPQVPEEGELPSARLTPFTRPFTYIGIDYFGPTQVSIGRRSQKRWCMLITCLTTRAVHMEVAHTLSADSCILGLRRFMNRRGKPREIYSDHGTNFRGSKRELRDIWDNIDKNRVAESFIDSETEWKFIPPASPHMGGAWERMVRTVKTSLKYALPYRLPSDELLLTMLAEVENIINNRPLTYIEIDNEYQEALTPNHFILGSSSGVHPLGEFRDDSAYMRQNWRKSQRFTVVFWKRWVAEYLPSLNRRTKWFESTNGEMKVGDIVVILAEDRPGSWPKGKVVEVHRSKDNKVRSASVTGIYTRPVSKLAILDVLGQDRGGTLGEGSRIPGGSVDSVVNNTQPESLAHCENDQPAHSTRNDRIRSLRRLAHRETQKEHEEENTAM